MVLPMGQFFGSPNYIRYRISMFLDVLHADAECNPAATAITRLNPIFFQPIDNLRALFGPYLYFHVTICSFAGMHPCEIVATRSESNMMLVVRNSSFCLRGRSKPLYSIDYGH